VRAGGASAHAILRKSLRRGEGKSYIAPAVAGSNPASGESCCSSNGREMANARAECSRRNCAEGLRARAGVPVPPGMVENGVTSSLAGANRDLW
jgi:hypothetical protein